MVEYTRVVMMEYPQRKRNRLQDFDYSCPRAYFITLCTENKQCLLGSVARASDVCPAYTRLSTSGKIVEAAILAIPLQYPALSIATYVINPNHLHMLLVLTGDGQETPSLSRVMQQMKGAVTKRLGRSIWQKSFHDHIVRDRADYQEIWQYIANNPARWNADALYKE